MSLARKGIVPLPARAEYRLYFSLLYPFVFVGSVISRVFGRRYTDDLKTNKSIFDESTAALNAALPWMFMGR